ncbi:Major pollen allergen ole e [Thalictrum thalictroides]|uniref:Major pollen allergen ole e n=1 Tax=Thalictrum thalictroides TaxID=46969 RepID=A0A7J6VIC7_THATH|nr:Major pollen allergen ole e [Thalictrum thalictroides]
MAKSVQAFLPLIAAIGFLSFLGFAICDETLFIEGKVYCDTCRTAFVTKLSQPIHGAKVALNCRDRAAGDVTYSLEGTTDELGSYKLAVEGDHEEEICEVKLISSPMDGCNEIVPGLDTARVLVTSNNGISELSRYVNSLGFLKAKPLTECAEILKGLGIFPSMIPPIVRQ